MRSYWVLTARRTPHTKQIVNSIVRGARLMKCMSSRGGYFHFSWTKIREMSDMRLLGCKHIGKKSLRFIRNDSNFKKIRRYNMKKLITMILIASAMIFGVDGFRTILNPTNPISGDTAEAGVIYSNDGRTWVTSGNSVYGSDGSTYSYYD